MLRMAGSLLRGCRCWAPRTDSASRPKGPKPAASRLCQPSTHGIVQLRALRAQLGANVCAIHLILTMSAMLGGV